MEMPWRWWIFFLLLLFLKKPAVILVIRLWLIGFLLKIYFVYKIYGFNVFCGFIFLNWRFSWYNWVSGRFESWECVALCVRLLDSSFSWWFCLDTFPHNWQLFKIRNWFLSVSYRFLKEKMNWKYKWEQDLLLIFDISQHICIPITFLSLLPIRGLYCVIFWKTNWNYVPILKVKVLGICLIRWNWLI